MLTNVQTLLVLLMIVGALVLIIAATNAAHLLLVDSLTMTARPRCARRWGRRHGVSRPGRARWACCGALATGGALLVAAAMAAPVSAYTKANVPRLSEVKLDAGVGATALGLGVALAIRDQPAADHVCGESRFRTIRRGYSGSGRHVALAPAVRRSSTRRSDRRAVDGGAALPQRRSLADVNPGFVAQGVSVFELMLPDSRYGSPAGRIELQRRLLELVEDLPGRQVAATVDVSAVRRRHLDHQHDDREPGRDGHDGEAARGAAGGEPFVFPCALDTVDRRPAIRRQ